MYTHNNHYHICNSYNTGARDVWHLLHEARGREAARGLSAINAMHPECTCYNYFISRGQGCHSYQVRKQRSQLTRYKDDGSCMPFVLAAVMLPFSSVLKLTLLVEECMGVVSAS